MAILISRPIDTSLIPNYFSYLPVRIHGDVVSIEDATTSTIERCSEPASKERQQALYRHSNPHGNPYAVCHPECEIQKLRLFIEVVEMIWIDDGLSFNQLVLRTHVNISAMH